jgi:hypothetical protein
MKKLTGQFKTAQKIAKKKKKKFYMQTLAPHLPPYQNPQATA